MAKNNLTKDEAKQVMSTLAILSQDLERKVWAIAGKLWMESIRVREKDPLDWIPYMENGFLTQREFSFLENFQRTKTKEERDQLIDMFKDLTYEAIVKVVQTVHLVSDIDKFLILVDDFFGEDMIRCTRFHEVVKEPWTAFRHLLSCGDDYISNLGSRIMAKLIVAHPKKRPSAAKIEFLFQWLKVRMDEDNEYLISVARCLRRLLQVDDYRMAFMNLNGVVKIIDLLASKALKPQAQYLFTFCLWVATFNPHLAEKLNQTGIIPILMDILERCPSEIAKLPRVVIATFRNLLEKPHDLYIRRCYALVMIQCNLKQIMELYKTRTDLNKDPEFQEDLQHVWEILNAYVAELTSLDEYSIELKSSMLKWSVVHTSKRFWKENAEHLNDNDYELLKILIDVLENCEDTTAICVAAHDVGEYVKHYPRGKAVVEKKGGKDALVRLLQHENPSVKFHALKALQYIMLKNPEQYAVLNKPDENPKLIDKTRFR